MIAVMKSGTESNIQLKRVPEFFCNEGTTWTIPRLQSTPLQDGRSSAKQSCGAGDQSLAEITNCPGGGHLVLAFRLLCPASEV